LQTFPWQIMLFLVALALAIAFVRALADALEIASALDKGLALNNDFNEPSGVLKRLGLHCVMCGHSKTFLSIRTFICFHQLLSQRADIKTYSKQISEPSHSILQIEIIYQP
jgi:hypothetical protein